jgi:hypothetical protein
MTTDVKKPSPNTVDDARAMNFTMYISFVGVENEQDKKSWLEQMLVKNLKLKLFGLKSFF